MASPSCLGLVAAVTLLVAAPASAQNADAPGVLKKQATTTIEAPAPVVQDTAQPLTDATSTPQTQTNNAKTPLTKGTAKKLAPTSTDVPAPAGANATGDTQPSTSHLTKRATKRTTRGATRSTTRKHATQRRHRAATHRTTRDRAASARSSRRVAGASPVTSTSPLTPAPVAAGSGARRHHPRQAQARTETTQSGTDAKRLDPITRAADRVVEVIPGPVILALAGLITLVFLLIVRSLTTAQRRNREMRRSYGITVEALATAIEAKDHTTGGHIERVRRLGLLLAEQIVPRQVRDPQMSYGFLLHDIGKLAVPDAILRAPGRLNEEQWAQMRRHPEEGVRMLSHVPFLDRALDVVLYHHERWDGGGYPGGLKGREIPLWARIFAVADALDAITADRPYRPGRSYSEALDEIRRGAGTQFDPEVVVALESIDPSVIGPLLEPIQQLPRDYEPLEELPIPDSLIPA